MLWLTLFVMCSGCHNKAICEVSEGKGGPETWAVTIA